MRDEIVTPDFKTTPFWWDGAPPEASHAGLPSERIDVAVVGGGLCGMFTALHLARGGLDVVVLDAGRPGEHASTRNAGAIGRTIRLKFSQLEARYGLETAKRIYEEAKDWTDYTADFIAREEIDCGFDRYGRVVGAHCPAAYDAAARELDVMSRHIAVDTEMVPAAEQARELGSRVYHGCSVLHDVGHLDPGRYHAGVCARARAAGVRIVGGTRVTNVAREAGDFRVATARGDVVAREVVLTTNAETGTDNPMFRHFHRRIVPVTAYSVVSEPLDPDLISRLIPTGRLVLETRRLYTSLRPIEGADRIQAVSRHIVRHRDEVAAAEAVRRDLAVRYPELAKIRMSHCWHGKFCITFDWLPHLGTHEGVHYLIGLNGAGVPGSGYLGQKLAQRILGGANRETVFADRPYPTKPGYTGSSWFLPAIAVLHRAADRREAGLPR